MNLNNAQRVALAICLVEACLVSFLAYSALGYFFQMLSIDTFSKENGVELIEAWKLIFSSLLVGAGVALLSFRPILKIVTSYGIPGIIPATSIDPSRKEGLRISLLLPDNKSYTGWSEHFSLWVKADALGSLLKDKSARSVKLRNPEDLELLLSIPERYNSPEERLLPGLIVKLRKNRVNIVSFEMSSQEEGIYNKSQPEGYAELRFPLHYLGCDDSMISSNAHAVAWLFVWGRASLINRALY